MGMPVILPPGVDPRYWYGGLVAVLLACYWVWDECNMQKNEYRAKEKGCETMHGERTSHTRIYALLIRIRYYIDRHLFPSFRQLPEKPNVLKCRGGKTLLVDGWMGKVPRSARDPPEIRPRYENLLRLVAGA